MAVKFDILTLFPELFGDFFAAGLMARAKEAGLLDVNLHCLRDFSESERGMIDDYPFGGGDSVVLAPEPLARALDAVLTEGDARPVIYLTPQGKTFNHERAQALVQQGGAILLCGRYGGVDQRIIDLYIDEEISIGDYVLMGGELPAMVVMEAASRFIPGVLGNQDSAANDSFQDALLEAPLYTRPRLFKGLAVPEVLLSGDHQAIEAWRRQQASDRTQARRPDLANKKLQKPKGFCY